MENLQTLYLRTITPVAVGSGEKLSPYSDFVIDENEKKLYIIDKEKIKQALAKKPELLDEYVEGVANIEGNRSNFNLNKFLKNRLNLDFKEIAQLAYPTSATVKGKTLLYTIIKNAGLQPYIPGSSLKGTIKTAILYDWLRNNEEGKKWIKKLIPHIQKFSAMLSKYPLPRERNSEQKRSYNVDAKKLSDERKIIDDEIERQLKEIASGEVNGYEQPLISIGDSDLIHLDQIKVYHTKRLHFKDDKKSTGIPQVWETIDKDVSLNVRYHLRKKAPKEILEMLRKFSLDAHDRDFSMLEDMKEHIEENTWNQLFDFYKHIEDKLDNGKICFKIGSGKGYFFNSIGLALHHYEGGKYLGDFLKTYDQTKFNNANLFPITKVIETTDNLPLGWVEVAIKPFSEIRKAVSETKEVKSIPENDSLSLSPAVKPVYAKPGITIKVGKTELNAQVVLSGKPNKVKLFISPDDEPECIMTGYKSPLDIGEMVVVIVNRIDNSKKVTEVGFKEFKK